jgi:hypothetical protein
MRGRPSSYSEEIANFIIERLVHGESLVAICKDEEMPNVSTIFRWLDKHKEFCDNYARARLVQAEVMASETIDIADNSTNDYIARNGKAPAFNKENVERSKLRVDARKWYASKLAPKKYGDRTILQGDKDADPVQAEITHDISARVAGIISQIAGAKAASGTEPTELDREGETKAISAEG